MFINRVVLISFLVATFVGMVFFGIRPDHTSYFEGSNQQIALLEHTSGPRIIVIGGSNVAFGIDAEFMQRELGVPAINDGLHAGLGVLPLLELEQYIHKGDTIILSLEYSMFYSRNDMDGNPVMLSDWIEMGPQRARYLSNPVVSIPSIYGIMLQRKVNRTLEYALNGGSLGDSREIFNSNNFNANGDFIGHLHARSEARKKIAFDPFPVWPIQEDMFIFLANFDQFARAKGAQVYFEAPASRQANCDVTGKSSLERFFDTFNQRLSIPVLTPIDEVCMPDKYFFDSPYHLNAEGRELRTRRLIEDLKQAWMNGK